MRHRIFISNGVLFLIVVALSFNAAGQTTTADPGTSQTQMALIRQAGDRLGVPVRGERIARFTQGTESMFVAPAANLASVPATTFPAGVNIGAAYFDMPSQSIPKGFYKLKAIADIKTVGKTVGRVQLIGETGSVASELPATFDVSSMTAAPNAASQPGNIAMCIGANCQGAIKQVTLIKHVSIICTFDTSQRISCWLGPAGLPGS
jgi:hypothetical protein